MKNKVFLLGILAVALVFGMTVVGCDFYDADYEGLSGDWDRGDCQITFRGNRGVFKDITGGYLLQAKNAGRAKIGDQVYRDIVKTNENEWTGEVRFYSNSSPYGPLHWGNCTITLMENGRLRVTGSFNSFYFTRM